MESIISLLVLAILLMAVVAMVRTSMAWTSMSTADAANLQTGVINPLVTGNFTGASRVMTFTYNVFGAPEIATHNITLNDGADGITAFIPSP